MYNRARSYDDSYAWEGEEKMLSIDPNVVKDIFLLPPILVPVEKRKPP